MKPTLLILTVAAQLAVGGAFAQTSTTTNGTADPGMSSGTFGSDWSTTLGFAMFSDGGTTLRSESEIASQWNTLSEEDKEMIRRDCAEFEQQSDATTGSTGSNSSSIGAGSDTTGTTSGSDTSASAPSATDIGSDMMSVSMEQMEQICAATNDL